MLRRCALFFVSLTIPCACLLLLESCGDESPSGPELDGPTGGNTVDTTPPAAVRGMVAKSPTANTLALQWVSPGDDGMTGQASRYDIRFATSVITDQDWDMATQVPDSLLSRPKPAGQIELYVVKGLPSGHDVYFALKSYDEASNESRLSNSPKGTTKSESWAPAAVTDLVANATAEGEFLLTWTATGDDGALPGAASEYDIRYSTSAITGEDFATASQATGEPKPSLAGTPERFSISGLSPATNYFFALKSADEVPNWSDISRQAPGLALNERMMVYPRDVFVGETQEVQIVFRLDATDEAELTISRLLWNQWPWRLVIYRHLVKDSFPAGSHHVSWDLSGDDGGSVDSDFGQLQVRLHVGATSPTDSVSVRIFEAR
jgi:hypothetical protein